MIKINLLPTRTLKKRENLLNQVLILLACTIFVLGGLIFYNMRLSSNIESLENRKQQTEVELKKYQAIVKKIDELQARIKAVTRRIELIKKISEHRSAVIRVLDQIVMSVEPGKIYLRSLGQSKEQLAVEATAIDHNSVAEFMDNIKTKADIKAVFLKGTSLKTAQPNVSETVDFGLNIDSIYKVPPPPPPKKGK